jgi:endo-alpha-1,4-polygalactosaminidase (GH114 family)
MNLGALGALGAAALLAACWSWAGCSQEAAPPDQGGPSAADESGKTDNPQLDGGPTPAPDPGPPTDVKRPRVGATWQWQLTGTIDTSVDADVFDIDLFDNDAQVVDELHAKGAYVICYLSVGSYEDWRPDAGDFPAAVLGNDYEGWAGEKWLDIRRLDLLGPIMRARLDLCKEKGFDGIEPDNMEIYSNDTGFNLTKADEATYARWLAKEAHDRGLSIGMKNTVEQVGVLEPVFDWALTEDCADQGWCDDMAPFVAHGKPVFVCEYTDTGATLGGFCGGVTDVQFSGILKHRDLDGWRRVCP